MGYSYAQTPSGRWALSCDGCGKVGGVRKRTCPHLVYDEHGHGLPYCPPPALCAECWHKHGRNAIHDECAAGARESQRRYDEIRARLAGGDAHVSARWGDWHATVPGGMIGVLYRFGDGRQAYHLHPSSVAKRDWLSEQEELAAWTDHA